MSKLMSQFTDPIYMDDVARGWGARDWSDAQRLIKAGYVFCLEMSRGVPVPVLVSRATMTVVGTVDEVRARLDAESERAPA